MKLLKPNLITVLLAVITSGCLHGQTPCNEKINLLPMYGGVKKCAEQIEADNKFIAEIDKMYPNRKEGAAALAKRGWDYMYAKDLETAMKRFNQAWLLDSLNADIYWGFADLLGMQGKHPESISFFRKAIEMDPQKVNLYRDASVAYGGLFVKTQKKVFLDSAITNLKTAAKLKPGDAQIYSQLTSAYTYFAKKDSARKYLKITESLDPKAVNPEVKKMLSDK